MKVSNLISDADRHYISNLIRSGAGELPDLNGNVSEKATHELIQDKGFIVGAMKIIRSEEESNVRQTRNRPEVEEED